MLGIKTWIAVADEREAVIYEAHKPRDAFQVATTLKNPGAKPDRELETDRPGRKVGANGQRHATDGERSTHETNRADFARRIAAELDRGRSVHGVRRLVVVAGPKMLGLVRDALDPHCRALLAAAVPKDLVRSDEQALRAHLPVEALRPEILR
jgi:protein required for attachment to host cells